MASLSSVYSQQSHLTGGCDIRVCSYLINKSIHWRYDDPALRLVVIKYCGLMRFFLAAAHALFSVFILSPAYLVK